MGSTKHNQTTIDHLITFRIMSEFTIIVHNRCRYLVHRFLVLSSGVPNATQGSVISKTVWIAKTTATIAAPNIAEAVETVETVWGQ